MISLEEYKNYLINIYVHEIDNNEEARQERSITLTRYGDDYLTSIINGTYIFIRKIFERVKNDYYEFYIDDNEGPFLYIYLGLHGGWFSDRLYKDIDGNFISEYILRKTFGKLLDIEVEDDEYERLYLYLQGFPDNMDEIKNELFGKRKGKSLIDNNK